MTIKRRILQWCAGVCVAFALADAGAAMLGAGDAAPIEVGQTIDGEFVRLDQYLGKVVVVSFWATWCPYCMKELPILEGIQKTAGGEHMKVIAVNTESGPVFRKVERALRSLSMQLAYDPGAKSAKAFGVKGIPHLVIVGRDGRIQKVYRGYGESSLEGIVADLNAALAVPAPL
jgi:thiol-disulfide isomerase/thioredoxin